MSDVNLSWSLTTPPQYFQIGNTLTESVVATDMGWTRVTGIAGTASSSSTAVTGTSTTFVKDLRVGMKIVVGTQVRTVATITDDTHLTTDTAFSPALSGATILRFEEVLVALSELLSKELDVLTVPTFTLAVPADGHYVTGQVLSFTVTASEAVLVENTPFINVTIGSTIRKATYDAASSTDTSLVFKYTVVAGDVDADGIVVATAISLNGGKVKDKILASGGVVDAASLAFTNTPVTTGITVN